VPLENNCAHSKNKLCELQHLIRVLYCGFTGIGDIWFMDAYNATCVIWHRSQISTSSMLIWLQLGPICEQMASVSGSSQHFFINLLPDNPSVGIDLSCKWLLSYANWHCWHMVISELLFCWHMSYIASKKYRSSWSGKN